MGGRWPFTEEKIASRLKLIEPYIFRKTHPLPAFRFLPLPEASVEAPICADPSGWDEIPHNSYWGGADLNFILKSSFAVIVCFIRGLVTESEFTMFNKYANN